MTTVRLFFCILLISKTLGLPILAQAQLTLQGQVVEVGGGQPLAGANVQLPGTGKGAITDAQGQFAITGLAAGEWVIRVSYVGYQTVQRRGQLPAQAQVRVELAPATEQLAGVEVSAARYLPPFTKTDVSRAELAAQNLGQDLPILLNFTPSVVTTSDAGAGVGYTGMRIRGSDPTRINVTLNGIPLNDAESQGVFWVNLPDFASSVQNIQVQRGVGTSVNGAGAFGASVNLTTLEPEDRAGVELNQSFGSFNTWKHNLIVNSGLLGGRFKVSGRLSKLTSDGFIGRAFSDLKSFYLSGVYLTKKGSLTANVFSGKEVTYQAWYGVPEAILREGNRRFNSQTYDNEVDNYQQDHYQLLYKTALGARWQLNAALHYTRGRGFFEQFRANDELARYGLAPVQVGGTTLERTDLVRRRWLDNHFFGGTWQLGYRGPQTRAGQPVLDVQWGGAANQYQGRHFGEVIWARFASNGNIRHRYYDNDAVKNDFNTFLKVTWQPAPQLFAFVDWQVRRVGYEFLGFDNLLRNVTQTAGATFFNPKLGARYVRGQHEWYASYSVGHREPNRDDFTQSSPASRPRAEQLQNLELGYALGGAWLTLGANLFYMHYRDQLVLTGQVNDTGGYIRQNMGRSYRAGLELQGALRLGARVRWQGNATVSRNKISEFREFLDDFDNGGQIATDYQGTDLAFSPNVVAASQWQYTPVPRLSLALLSKYVGRQYLDNTQNLANSLEPYFTNDLRVSYTLAPKPLREVGLSLLVNNLLNAQYESNGYNFGYISGGQRVYENFYFPQAGTHFLAQITVKF
jgi:iron complex outermembrane recepter protein